MNKKSLLTSVSVVIALLLFVIIFDSFHKSETLPTGYGYSHVVKKHHQISRFKSEINNNLFNKFN